MKQWFTPIYNPPRCHFPFSTKILNHIPTFIKQRFYVATSRQLKRIDSVKRSPIYAHFSETISGVSTIRAYNREDAFVDKADVLVDGNNMAYYPTIVSNRFVFIHMHFIPYYFNDKTKKQTPPPKIKTTKTSATAKFPFSFCFFFFFFLQITMLLHIFIGLLY